VPAHAFWFGEDQARYVVTVCPHKVAEVIKAFELAHVPLGRLGTTGGDALTVPGERAMLVANLRQRFEAWFPRYMAGP
jgi:phosphoribosylformylglycinamidine synthase subunit PurL